MKVEKAQDVLMHKRLQHMARTISSTPAIEVRLLQVRSMPRLLLLILIFSTSSFRLISKLLIISIKHR